MPVPAVNTDEVNHVPEVVPVPVQTKGGQWVAGIIVPGTETEEGGEMERSGIEGTAVKEITDEGTVVEKERGGESWRSCCRLGQGRSR